MASEVVDQDQSCSSEDLCSLEVQGSDSSPYGILHTAPTDGSCTSLELCTRDSSRCHHGLPGTSARPSDTGYSESSHTQESLERSPDWSSENVSNLDQEDSTDITHACEEFRAAIHMSDELASAKHLPEEPPKASTHSLIKARMMSQKLTLPVAIPPPPQPCSPTSVASSGGTSAISSFAPSPSPSPPSRPRGPRLCFSVWSQSSASHPPSTSAQSGYSPSERPRGLRAARRYHKLARIVRSTSDPISCSSTSRESCSDAASNHPAEDSAHISPEQEPTDNSAETAGAKSTHICARKHQKESIKVDIHHKTRVLHTRLSYERPHSLADLKMYKDTKILVAKFLEHSSCSLPPEVQQVVNNIKCVIKSDEKHMEEAIFSANVIDQVMTQRVTGSSRKHGHEDLHLQSCGALSLSPSLSLRHPKHAQQTTSTSTNPLASPSSENSLVCRETIL
ncbi:hypothetical protein LDENG_00177820 [Lucifuga dentata]|nr:hypothetical protein LDENG_00177820 [Lucifuga dentata]